jgi:hypothetical protein
MKIRYAGVYNNKNYKKENNSMAKIGNLYYHQNKKNSWLKFQNNVGDKAAP